MMADNVIPCPSSAIALSTVICLAGRPAASHHHATYYLGTSCCQQFPHRQPTPDNTNTHHSSSQTQVLPIASLVGTTQCWEQPSSCLQPSCCQQSPRCQQPAITSQLLVITDRWRGYLWWRIWHDYRVHVFTTWLINFGNEITYKTMNKNSNSSEYWVATIIS